METAIASRERSGHDDAGRLISGAAVAITEAALRVQQLEGVTTDSLHLILIRRVLDALDDASDSLDFMKEA